MHTSKYKPIGRAIKFGYLIIIILFSAISLLTIAIAIKNSISYNKMTLSIVEYQNAQKEFDLFTSYVQDNFNKKDLLQNKFNDSIKKINTSINTIKENTIANGGNNNLALQDIESFKEQRDIFIKFYKTTTESKDSIKVNDALHSLSVENDFIKASTSELINKQLNLSSKLIKKMQTTFYMIIFFVIITITAIIIYSLYFSIKLSTNISGSLNKLVKAAQSISNMDLNGKDVVIETNDEFLILANAFNTMKNSLKTLVKNMHEVAYNTYYSSNELDKSIKQNLIISEQIFNSLTEISKRAEIQANQMLNNAKAINNTCAIAIKIKRFINEKMSSNSAQASLASSTQVDDYKLISISLIQLTEKIMVIKNSNDCLKELLTEFAVNSEKIATSSKEQNNQYKKVEQISNILNSNAAKLDELVRNINIYES